MIRASLIFALCTPVLALGATLDAAYEYYPTAPSSDLDGGTYNHIIRVQANANPGATFWELGLAAAAWHREDTKESIYKLDTVNGAFGLQLERTLPNARIAVTIPVGFYYPLRWHSQGSKLYENTHWSVGLDALIERGPLTIAGKYRYVQAVVNSASTEVEAVSIKLNLLPYHHLEAHASLSILDIITASGQLGTYFFRETKLALPMEEVTVAQKDIVYWGASARIALVPTLLDATTGITVPFNKVDTTNVHLLTGARTLPGTQKSFSVGLVGSF